MITRSRSAKIASMASPASGRRIRDLPEDLARLDLRPHRPLADTVEVIGRPIGGVMRPAAEFVRVQGRSFGAVRLEAAHVPVERQAGRGKPLEPVRLRALHVPGRPCLREALPRFGAVPPPLPDSPPSAARHRAAPARRATIRSAALRSSSAAMALFSVSDAIAKHLADGAAGHRDRLAALGRVRGDHGALRPALRRTDPAIPRPDAAGRPDVGTSRLGPVFHRRPGLPAARQRGGDRLRGPSPRDRSLDPASRRDGRDPAMGRGRGRDGRRADRHSARQRHLRACSVAAAPVARSAGRSA